MANKLLELRNWSVDSADEERALLKHRDGHEMHVAIKALPRLQQEQIKKLMKMDEGGAVTTFDPKDTANIAKAMGAPKPPSPPQPQPQPKPQMYADGGMTKEELDKAREKGDEKPYRQDPDTGLYSETTNDETSPPDDSAVPNFQHAAGVPGSHPINININPSSPSVGSQIPQPAPPPQANPPSVPAAAQVPMPGQQAPPPSLPSQPAFSSEQAQGEQVGATRELAKGQQELLQRQNSYLADMKQHTDDFAEHLQANPINPNAYSESQSDAQRFNTAIGLFLGGLGGMGKGNSALDFLNKQIDRNIDAQKANIEREKNIYGAYQHLYDNDVVASNLTRASLLDIADSKMKLAALKIGTPQALNNYNTFSSGVQVQKGQLLQTAAAAKAQGGGDEIQSILKPGQDISQAQYNPKLKPYLSELTSQFTNAQQADRLLNQLPAIFDEMQLGRGLGHFASSVAHQLPLIGGAMEQAIKSSSPDAQRFDTAKSRLYSELTNALRGTNVSSDQIQKIIDNNSLTEIDKPSDIKRKMKNIELFIKNAVPHSLLDSAGVLNPKSGLQ
jgi:hypothetical protein